MIDPRNFSINSPQIPTDEVNKSSNWLLPFIMGIMLTLFYTNTKTINMDIKS